MNRSGTGAPPRRHLLSPQAESLEADGAASVTEVVSMVAWRHDDTPHLSESIIDFPTTSTEDWLAQGHEALTPAEAAKRIGVSVSTLRRELFTAPPLDDDGPLHVVSELRGQQFTAWKITEGRRVRWQIYLLGTKSRRSNGHGDLIAELRTQVEPSKKARSRWWPFGR